MPSSAIYTGWFFRLALTCSVPKLKRLTGQSEGLSDEGVHGTAAPVGSLAIFSFSTEQGGPVEKITL